MITNLKIDFNNLPRGLDYIKKLKFKDEYEFKPGLNIIIGKNGSGKTTLLNILSNMTMSTYGHTHVFNNIRKHDQVRMIFKDTFMVDQKDIVRTGITIGNEWRLPVFKLLSLRDTDMDMEMGFDAAANLANKLETHHDSNGELMVDSMNTFVTRSQRLLQEYDLKKMLNTISLLKSEIKNYIKETQVNSNPPRITFLMDEPDQGLDIVRLDNFRKFVVRYFEGHQVILVLHNPVLIYKLRKIANFIEMTPDYLNKVIKFIEK